jgi:hypothetical protein
VLLAQSRPGGNFTIPQKFIDRAGDPDPRCAALKVLCCKASLRLKRGTQRRIFSVFLDQ